MPWLEAVPSRVLLLISWERGRADSLMASWAQGLDPGLGTSQTEVRELRKSIPVPEGPGWGGAAFLHAPRLFIGL